MGLADKKIFNIDTIRLTKKVGLWFENFNARRVKDDNRKNYDLDDFKEKTSCNIYSSKL